MRGEKTRRFKSMVYEGNAYGLAGNLMLFIYFKYTSSSLQAIRPDSDAETKS